MNGTAQAVLNGKHCTLGHPLRQRLQQYGHAYITLVGDKQDGLQSSAGGRTKKRQARRRHVCSRSTQGSVVCAALPNYSNPSGTQSV